MSEKERMNTLQSHFDELERRYRAVCDTLRDAMQQHPLAVGRSGERLDALAVEVLDSYRTALERLAELSDVGVLFDGHDELNEYTHEANERQLTQTLDRVHAIAECALSGREDCDGQLLATESR